MAVKSSLRLLFRGLRFRSLIDWFAETFHCFFSLVSFVIYRFTAWSWETTQNILYESCWLILTGLLRVLSELFDKISWIICDLSFEFAQQKSQCAADPVVLCEGKKMWSDSINKMKQVGAGDVEPTEGLTGQNCLDVFSTGLYCVSKLLESRMKWWSVGNSVQRLVFDKPENSWLFDSFWLSATPSETCTCLNSFSPVLLY